MMFVSRIAKCLVFVGITGLKWRSLFLILINSLLIFLISSNVLNDNNLVDHDLL